MNKEKNKPSGPVQKSAECAAGFPREYFEAGS
jgi:hypothetical protein